MFHHHVVRVAAPALGKAKAVAVAKARPAEHLGFVAYAGAEVFHLGHAAVYAVAFYLFVSGALMIFNDFGEIFLGKEL